MTTDSLAVLAWYDRPLVPVWLFLAGCVVAVAWALVEAWLAARRDRRRDLW
jgi:hypothetical protein